MRSAAERQPSDDDYPDCSADAADSQSYAAGDASGGVAAAEAKTGDFGTAKR